jgi:hypothetical protein
MLIISGQSQTEKKEPKPSGFCMRPTVGVSVDGN